MGEGAGGGGRGVGAGGGGFTWSFNKCFERMFCSGLIRRCKRCSVEGERAMRGLSRDVRFAGK